MKINISETPNSEDKIQGSQHSDLVPAAIDPDNGPAGNQCLRSVMDGMAMIRFRVWPPMAPRPDQLVHKRYLAESVPIGSRSTFIRARYVLGWLTNCESIAPDTMRSAPHLYISHRSSKLEGRPGYNSEAFSRTTRNVSERALAAHAYCLARRVVVYTNTR